MAVELATMALLIAGTLALRPRANPWAVLVPVLLVGRVLYVGLVWGFARMIDLPARWVAGLSLLSGWPGIVLMIVVVPPVVHAVRWRGERAPGPAQAGGNDGPGRRRPGGAG
jgi:hypothetical protein